MDRLPRDMASERLHHDIVRLLDEHIPRSPQMVNVIPNNTMMSKYWVYNINLNIVYYNFFYPNFFILIDIYSSNLILASPTGQMIQHPTVIVPKRQKSKRPNKSNNNMPPTSPEIEGAHTGSIRRKPSVKKNNKKQNTSQMTDIPQSVDSIASTLSPVESPMANLPSPYDTTSMYSNMGMAGLEGIMGNKQPPSYEDVCGLKSNTMQHLVLDNYTYFPDHLIMQQRQMQPNTLSPPYSNQSPPHSVQSNMSMSPQGYNGSPSPAKTRPSLPTSPTHIAAMRAATQQKHGGIPQTQNLPMGYDFSQASLDLPVSFTGQTMAPTTLQPQQFQQQNYYLTPPSQHSDAANIMPDFSTPSPESPGHWSSSSPHSINSDWSENITSPNTYQSGGHQTNKGSDAIYI